MVKPHISIPQDGASIPFEVRISRILAVIAVIGAVLLLVPFLMSQEVPAKNDVYIGMVIGFLVSKAGTIIDWLFGGSESGSRRTDKMLHSVMPDGGTTLHTNDSVSVQTPAEGEGAEGDEGDRKP